MNRSRILVSTAALLCASIAAPPAVAGILYVDASATTGANDGSSWADAFQGASGLRLALAAAVAGDQIWVADGTYLPTLTGVRTRSFDLKSGVSLYGGFAGGETSLSQRDPAVNVAILSGDLLGDDAGGNFADNSYHVLSAVGLANLPTVDGFAIRGGNADGSGSAGNGGGMFSQSSNWGTPLVRQCVFESNRCTGKGGAFYLAGDNGSPGFEDCTFRDNHAGISGGAVQFDNGSYGGTFTRCIFTANSATNGSAADFFLAFDVFLDDCLICGNTGGTAVYAHTESYLWVSSCTVAANDSAGLYSYADSGIWSSIVYFNTHGQLSGFPFAGYSCVQGGTLARR